MTRRLKAGEWVEVRSKAEILATLDPDGRLDGMPFMPEMFEFAGKRLQVFKRAHKTCDTVFPVRGRRVEASVHLDTRCDGKAHGGCQAGCLLFWKDAWLKPVEQGASPVIALPANGRASQTDPSSQNAMESIVWKSCQSGVDPSGAPIYVCQATRLPYATTHLPWWDLRQYLEDYVSGNVGLRRIVKGLIYATYFKVCQAGLGLGRPLRWLYNRLAPLWGGSLFPRSTGTIPDGQPTPAESLGLQPGEIVRVKPHAEILRTLTVGSRNRGLWWDAEFVPYCGGTYKVHKRVTHIIDEKTGVMLRMKTPCIILDSVVCQARYSDCRMFCPRSIYPYWREIWLERAAPGSQVRDGPMY